MGPPRSPARAAPLVVPHPIGLLSGDMAPGCAAGLPTAHSDAQPSDTHERVGEAKGPRRQLLDRRHGSGMCYRRFRGRDADFPPVDPSPVDLIAMTARSCRAAAI